MAKVRVPSTPAIRMLRAHDVTFEPFVYPYEPHGGTRAFADASGLDEHLVVKTLIVVDDQDRPLVVLMHGDCEVSLKELARQLGVKRCRMADPAEAERYSGYRTGGTSPLGMKRPLPVHVEASILDLDHLYLNGGARGLIVGLSPADLASVLEMTPVQVAVCS